MTPAMTWVHIGDLHMDEADGLLSRHRLDKIVAEIGTHIGEAADVVFLPGDNANHATPEQYRQIVEGLAPLRLPYRVILSEREFEPGDLANYEAAFPKVNRPQAEVAPASGTAFRHATVPLAAGLHRVTVSGGADRDTIQLLVRAEDDIAPRGAPVAPGCDIHTIGAWPEHGIAGTRLGPNRNGMRL